MIRTRMQEVAEAPGREATGGGRLADLYLRHAGGALRLAYLLTGDRDLADDLVQDAFVYMSGRLAHLRDPNSFEAYLRRTVVNLANGHFRRRKVERAYLAMTDRDPGPTDHDVVLLQTLRSALLRLPARQRAAVVLRFFLDLPDTEIADHLRCRRGTVRSLVSRALPAMRAELEGARGEADGG